MPRRRRLGMVLLTGHLLSAAPAYLSASPTGDNAMHGYKVTFTIDDKRYHRTVSAGTSNDPRRLIQSQFPKAVIWDVRKV